MQAGKHGSFLVRNRQSVEHQYALSVRLDDNVHHVIVVYEVSQLTHMTQLFTAHNQQVALFKYSWTYSISCNDKTFSHFVSCSCEA